MARRPNDDDDGDTVVVRRGAGWQRVARGMVETEQGPMLLVEVQRRVLVSSGGITYLVDRLVRKGLVERRPCSHDRRAAYAALTPEGERMIGSIFPAHAEAIAHAVAGLTDAEKKQAIRLLKKLGIHAAQTPPLDQVASAADREQVGSTG